MANEGKCPKCGFTSDIDPSVGNETDPLCMGCQLAISLWPFVRDLQRRAEIGARAVELLREASISAMMPKKYRPRIRTLVADARAAGMVNDGK